MNRNRLFLILASCAMLPIEAADYQGKIGKLEAVFSLEWHDDGSVTGAYGHPAKPGTIYSLEGNNPAEGELYLEEYTGDTLTARCYLRKVVTDGVILWRGEMRNTDGSILPMEFARALGRIETPAPAAAENVYSGYVGRLDARIPARLARGRDAQRILSLPPTPRRDLPARRIESGGGRIVSRRIHRRSTHREVSPPQAPRTLLAAFYPAFVPSSFQPIYSIKTSHGASGLKGGRSVLRKSLVVLQFVAAVVLITGAIGFYRQLHFMQTRDLGVNIKQTLVVQQSGNADSTGIPAFNAFINDMTSNPSVQSVTASTSVPGAEVSSSSDYTLKNSLSGKRCRNLGIDNKFFDAYGLSIVAGRNITNDRPPVDTNVVVNILVNETAAKTFGFSKPADMLGKEMNDGSGFRYAVVGIVKDYHQESLQNSFHPIVFYPEVERYFGNFSFILLNKLQPLKDILIMYLTILLEIFLLKK